eukprot:scaffold136_cov418-Prasinococcus_capsulatus_cf.AAC.3
MPGHRGAVRRVFAQAASAGTPHICTCLAAGPRAGLTDECRAQRHAEPGHSAARACRGRCYCACARHAFGLH